MSVRMCAACGAGLGPAMTACLRCGAAAPATAPEPAPAAPVAPVPAPVAPVVASAPAAPALSSPPWGTLAPAPADLWRASSEGAWTQTGAPPTWAHAPAAPSSNYDTPTSVRYASWWERAKAMLLDELLAILAAAVLVFAVGDAAVLLVNVAALANIFVMQGLTGQTLGKRKVGITVVREKDQQPVGLGLNFVRQVAHILDVILLVGFLLPLFDKKKRTIADIVCRTIVIS